MSRPEDYKPRVCIVRGCSNLWKCSRGGAPYGYGDTPAAAYARWEELKAKEARRPGNKSGEGDARLQTT